MPAVIAAAPIGLNKKFLATALANKAFLNCLTTLTIVCKEAIKAAILLTVKAAASTIAKDLIKTMFSEINLPTLASVSAAELPKLMIFPCSWSMSVD